MWAPPRIRNRAMNRALRLAARLRQLPFLVAGSHCAGPRRCGGSSARRAARGVPRRSVHGHGGDDGPPRRHHDGQCRLGVRARAEHELAHRRHDGLERIDLQHTQCSGVSGALRTECTGV